MVRGWCENQMVEMTALVATRAARSLCSATMMVNAGCSIELRPTQSVLRHSGGGCLPLQRCGKRDFLSIRVREFVSELCALRTGHFLKSGFPGHLTRNFDTSLTVTPSVTNGVRSA